jgi:hypothetical protein
MPSSTLDAEDQLRAWEWDRLLELEFTPAQAEELIAGGVSWREAARLVEEGCPQQLAVVILL